MPAAPPSDVPEACPGCGSVLAPVTEASPHRASHPGASPSCARLFEVTLHGLREEVAADPGVAAVLRQADAAYDAQHPVSGDPERLRTALERLGASSEGVSDGATPPAIWRTTIADVAADLDVIDLAVLVESWAQATREDWSATVTSVSSRPSGSEHVS